MEYSGPLIQYDWCPYKKRRKTQRGEHYVKSDTWKEDGHANQGRPRIGANIRAERGKEGLSL